MGAHPVSSLCCMLSFLLFLISVRLATGRPHTKGCSSSCGRQSIRYPFSLKRDPASCGPPSFQLICEGNQTVLRMGSKRYNVTEISYKHQTITVVDSGLASDNCALPNQSSTFELRNFLPAAHDYLSMDEMEQDDYFRGHQMRVWLPFPYWLDSDIWASFVNCTRQIKKDEYRLIPNCPSQNDAFVYVVVGEDAYYLRSLEPSCRFLATIPMARSPDHADSSTSAGVFKLLREGFVLSWFQKQGPFRYCLADARRMSREVMTPGPLSYRIPGAYAINLELISCIVGRYTRIYSFRTQLVLYILALTVEHLIILAALGRLVFQPLVVYLFLAYTFWSTRASIDGVEKFLRNQRTLIPTRYSYTDVVAMTGHFKEKVGRGGFGSVFKGKLLGDHLVAIKMLGNSKCNGEEFINEVATIGRIHHVNVVQLVGFSSEGSRRALVYEYMRNGSLDKYIFSSSGTTHPPPSFTWDRLHDIALGVARGIDYLHRGCDMQILHFDIKPQNILLDHNFTPKISDFGLAKLYPKEYGLVSMSAAGGTIGYIAPELISRNFGVISDKSDVYSFGMLLLDMAGGRRNVDQKVESSSEVYFPSWIYDRLAPGKELEINYDGMEICEAERKLCIVGLWCIQMKSSCRPSMSEVIEMLEGDVDSLQMPPRPCFSSQPIAVGQSCMDSSLMELSIISEDDELP